MSNRNRTIILIFCIVTVGIFFSDCGGTADTPYKQGRGLYLSYCANCHNENGTGLMSLVPPLAQANYINLHRIELPCIIRHGLKGTINVNSKPYSVQNMPALNQFTSFEVTNILNYIGSEWGNKEKLWTVDEVDASLNKCPE